MRRTITAVVGLALSGMLATVVLAGTVNGTAKNDSLRGSAKADTINGKAGNDKLFGLAGNDKLMGGAGNDVLDGGPGADNLNCGAGSDAAKADDSDNVSASCERVTGLTPRTISISDASVGEGNSGAATLSFAVTLSGKSFKPVSVEYRAADGAATQPADYAAASGKLSFKPGETAKTIAVSVVGELVYESDEALTVTLSNPTNATIADGSANGTITNDDTLATPGHYSGKTSQNEAIDFDVNPAGNGVAGVRTGQINQSCRACFVWFGIRICYGGSLSEGRLDFGTETFSISAERAFALDKRYQGTVSGDDGEATTENHVVLTGRFSDTAASGTLLVETSFTLGEDEWACTTNPQTWNAARS